MAEVKLWTGEEIDFEAATDEYLETRAHLDSGSCLHDPNGGIRPRACPTCCARREIKRRRDEKEASDGRSG